MNPETQTVTAPGDRGPGAILLAAVIIALLVIATLAIGERFCPRMRPPDGSHAER